MESKIKGVKRETIVMDLKQKQLIIRYVHRTLEKELENAIDEKEKGLIEWKIGKARMFWGEINDALNMVMDGGLDKTKKYKVGIGISNYIPQENSEFDKPYYDRYGNKLDTDPYKEFKIEKIIQNLGALRSLLYTARSREWEKSFAVNLSFWQRQAKNMKEYAESLSDNSFYKFTPIAVLKV